MKIITLFLSCKNKKESDVISKHLLAKRLVVCAKETQVSSSFLWQNKISNTKESLLVMDSVEENFAQVEKEVRKLHAYKDFVLLALPVIRTNKEVVLWIKKEIKL